MPIFGGFNKYMLFSSHLGLHLISTDTTDSVTNSQWFYVRSSSEQVSAKDRESNPSCSRFIALPYIEL